MQTETTFAQMANEEAVKLCAKSMVQARGLSPRICAAAAQWIEASAHYSNPFDVLPVAFTRVETMTEPQLRREISGEIYNTAMTGR